MRARISSILVVLLCTAASTLGISNSSARRELAANRTKWASHGITDYEFQLRDENCFCMYAAYYGPIRVIVRNGKITKAIYEGERRDGYWPGRIVREKTELVATVEDLFKRAEDVINAKSKAPFSIRYDGTYGFPVVIDVRNPPKIADAQWRLVVDGFRPTK